MRCYILFKFEPEKLRVNYKDGIGTKELISPRRYTLTHSDETAELFLSIGKNYDFDSIDYDMRDEVLGTWEKGDNYYILITVEVDNIGGLPTTIIRDKIFREELPLALMAIVYGDNLFFENNKELYEAKVVVRFNSKIKEYDCVEEWGKIKDYKYSTDRINEENENNFSQYNINPFPILPPVPPVKNPYYNKFMKNPKLEMCNVVEKALIVTLEPYISSEVYTVFGKNTPYCIRKAEIIDAKVVNTYGPCSEEYEVTVGLKVGRRPPFYNNMIITFLIDENGVKVKGVKNPRV